MQVAEARSRLMARVPRIDSWASPWAEALLADARAAAAAQLGGDAAGGHVPLGGAAAAAATEPAVEMLVREHVLATRAALVAQLLG